jgi:hypothetical protein
LHAAPLRLRFRPKPGGPKTRRRVTACAATRRRSSSRITKQRPNGFPPCARQLCPPTHPPAEAVAPYGIARCDGALVAESGGSGRTQWALGATCTLACPTGEKQEGPPVEDFEGFSVSVANPPDRRIALHRAAVSGPPLRRLLSKASGWPYCAGSVRSLSPFAAVAASGHHRRPGRRASPTDWSARSGRAWL